MSNRAGTDGLVRVIGFWGGLAVIVGTTIGSGVFRKPYTLARDVGDPVTIVGLWVVFWMMPALGRAQDNGGIKFALLVDEVVRCFSTRAAGLPAG